MGTRTTNRGRAPAPPRPPQQVQALGGLVTCTTLLMPCCMRTTPRKAGMRCAPTVRFPSACFGHEVASRFTPTSFFKSCAFERVQSSSPWWVPVLNQRFVYTFALLTLIRSHPPPPPPAPKRNHLHGPLVPEPCPYTEAQQARLRSAILEPNGIQISSRSASAPLVLGTAARSLTVCPRL